jgi:4-aminobutyrate aminotransferase
VTSVKSKYRLHYEPFVPGVYFAPFAYPYRCPMGATAQDAVDWSLRGIQKLFDHQVPPCEVAAFILEPVLGEGGYVVPPAEFLHALRRICDRHGILLIFDEVQTGFGRTGEMFAAQTFGVRPDIMAVAKGIAAGFPLSATIASPELMCRWKFGSHGTTCGGNPVACAAGLASLEVIQEEGLLENCRAMGARLRAGLGKLADRYAEIGEVRGVGLMVAMELVQSGPDRRPNPELARALLMELLQRRLIGLSAGTEGHVVRLMPPLIVDASQVDLALEIMGDSLSALLG